MCRQLPDASFTWTGQGGGPWALSQRTQPIAGTWLWNIGLGLTRCPSILWIWNISFCFIFKLQLTYNILVSAVQWNSCLLAICLNWQMYRSSFSFICFCSYNTIYLILLTFSYSHLLLRILAEFLRLRESPNGLCLAHWDLPVSLLLLRSFLGQRGGEYSWWVVQLEQS